MLKIPGRNRMIEGKKKGMAHDFWAGILRDIF